MPKLIYLSGIEEVLREVEGDEIKKTVEMSGKSKFVEGGELDEFKRDISLGDFTQPKTMRNTRVDLH